MNDDLEAYDTHSQQQQSNLGPPQLGLLSSFHHYGGLRNVLDRPRNVFFLLLYIFDDRNRALKASKVHIRTMNHSCIEFSTVFVENLCERLYQFKKWRDWQRSAGA